MDVFAGTMEDVAEKAAEEARPLFMSQIEQCGWIVESMNECDLTRAVLPLLFGLLAFSMNLTPDRPALQLHRSQ